MAAKNNDADPHAGIMANNMIQSIHLLRRRAWYTWITVWPFVVLYTVSIVLYMDPELVWDRITYLVHQTYIDFFHAICFPVVLFFHAFLSLFTQWSMRFRARILFHPVSLDQIEDATDVLVVTHAHKGESEIVKVVQATHEHPTCFIFQQRKWRLNDETNTFTKPIFPTKQEFGVYVRATGLANEAEREKQMDLYGPNKMEVTIPEFQDLFVDHALAPFFVFQMFCVLLWCLDEYWYFSLFTGVMMAGMECVTIFQRMRNMKSLRDMSEVPVREMTVLRGGREVAIRSTELLPMDVLVVPSNCSFPVDAVLIRGTAVVNEASLTGESTPQLKEAPDDANVVLSSKLHGRHMLFSGTQVLLSSGPQANNTTDDDANASTHTAPRALALAVVLKTGYETRQGKLLRTILHSQGRVSENSGEAFGFIGVLVVFAIAASGYLLQRGLADPNRSRWRLFLNCVQIITSVVPPELPMELSLAVNNSLMSLSKLQVFCTEPFRIPYAGMVDTCCFDKTGTLTTDEMLFGGVNMVNGKGLMNQLHTMPSMAEMVLATCHSLVYLDEHTLAGDEMEKAATGALGYRMKTNDRVVYDPPPGKDEKAVAPNGDAKHGSSSTKKTNTKKPSFDILLRFPFVAALRRMACVVRGPDGLFIVAKGAPGTVAPLCADAPRDALQVADEMAAKGLRVIALAYRRLSDAEASSPELIADLRREDAEAGLHFAGLAVYICPLKKDARETIDNLQGGSHRCIIITGDSVQTAISVGKDVGMLATSRQLIATVTKNNNNTQDGGATIAWKDTAPGGEVLAATDADIIANTFVRTRKHAKPSEKEWELCVDASELPPGTLADIITRFNEHITIWARCAPSDKEAIVTDLKHKKHMVLMAGDGTNDVGALKQAHAGIAVLNSTSVAPAAKTSEDGTTSAPLPVGPQPHNEPDLPADCLLPPGFTMTVVPNQPPPGAPFMEMMRWKMAETKRKTEIKQLIAWNKKVAETKQARADKMAALPPMPNDPLGGSDFMMESLFNADDESFGGPPMIKLGDASIAAPFTCRSKALTSVCDIVRLGRSTLVTTHMMYKILALNCLNSAYSMSVLHSDGVKLGEKQMILAGMIMSVCFMCMSRSKPLDHLCPQRPITRVFHPYMICSVFFQFALHLYGMMSTAAMVAEVDAAAMEQQRDEAETSEFKPTLLNSTMFLMTTLMSAVTFIANYRGEPFMQRITRNRPMFVALIILCVLVFYFAAEVDPEVNELLEIVVFPSEEFRHRFVKLLAMDAIGCVLVENICLYLFTDY